MRYLPLLLLAVFVAGCPAGKAPQQEKTTPEKSDAPSRPPAATERKDITYTGTWTTRDEKGQPFDLVLFPNGQVVGTWSAGPQAARGQRGSWRQENGKLIVLFDDGSTGRIAPVESGFEYTGFPAGASLDAPPGHQAEATRLDEKYAPYVGVWRLNKEPDGSYLYIALQSGGRAISTINGLTEGRWEITEKGALCTWPDGWVDLIERAPEGWQKRSWVGAETAAQADLSIATRVGETRFDITP